MAGHSSSTGPRPIERTKYVSFFVDPEWESPRMVADPERLNHHLSRGDFRLESRVSALHKDRVCFDRNHGKSLRKVIGRVIPVVHTNVKDSTAYRFRLLQDLWSVHEGNSFA